jgi:hypothetical protein
MRREVLITLHSDSAFGAPDSLGAHTPKKPATL